MLLFVINHGKILRSMSNSVENTFSRDLVTLHIGIDDTDEFFYGCTTNFLRELIKTIHRSSISKYVQFIDYPYLTRLNPSIPYKTRGNGAVSLHIQVHEHAVRDLLEILRSLASDIGSGRGAEPGVVVVYGSGRDEVLRDYYSRVLSDVIYIDVAERIINKLSGEIIARGRGIVGALGSISNFFVESDCTYEILGYSLRDKEFYIDPDRVYLMDKSTKPYTFNNIDPETNKILITPRIGRPVVLGVRGESPQILIRAIEILKPEGVDEYLIFKTNQGTDQHLVPRELSEAKPYRTGLFIAQVSRDPEIRIGGDIFIEITDPSNNNIKALAAIYREFGENRLVARNLVKGDLVEIGGSVKPLSSGSSTSSIVINVEYLKILKLRTIYIERNPLCPKCGSRMISRGKNKGFKCPRCGYIDPYAKKMLVEKPRDTAYVNMILKPPPRNTKHLTKPLQRFGLEKICKKSIKGLEISEFFYIA